MLMDFKVIQHNSPEYHQALELRYQVLIKPTGLDSSVENPEAEAGNVHIAGFRKTELVATAMLVPKGNALKIQRVAVRADLQGQGVGTAMMKFCEDYARENGISEVFVHARDKAVNFYDKNHYSRVGEYFEEDTIPHLKMKKSLNISR